MENALAVNGWYCVALLAEGVDRNLADKLQGISGTGSPSSRRAWIEIFQPGLIVTSKLVALLAEGVDRNSLVIVQPRSARGRPPRGGRG